ncbi:MAG: FAD:protein FMN transferase, partial [Longimicrobiales bacterium]|nr:FAD:protein FMN transferase [Longimicrobiales bacterium]
RSMSRRDALRISAGVGIGAAFGVGVGVELLRRAGLQRVRETRVQMGTLVTLTVVHPESAAARMMVERAFAEMERLEAQLSRYRPDSAVGRLNKTGRLEAAPAALVDVLTLGLDVSRRSRGAFDVTVAPLVELHTRTFERTGAPPRDQDIRRALDYVGYQGLKVVGRQVGLADPRMQISLDGVAKGFIVDRTVSRLSRDGAERVLVDAGGDMASGGVGVESEPWTVGVQHPRSAQSLIGRVELQGGSIATSGDYLRHFTPDRRHHDILDPRTGRSPVQASSATVIAPSAAEADALSTASLVLGAVDGIAMIDAYRDAEALLVSKNDGRVTSRGMVERLG